MNNLKKIHKFIGIDERLISIYKKEITPPDFEFRWKPVSDFFYPFPPFLIPIFVDNGEPGYFATINHFFIERESPFVFFSLEAGCVWENARTVEQYFTNLIMDMISSEEGITEEIIAFTKDINFNPTKKIWDFMLSSDYNGSSIESYKNLDIFYQDIPLLYCDDLSKYKGDFPSSFRLFNKSMLYKSCSFEIAKEEYLKEVENLPEWLKENSNKKELFYKYVNNNELDKAWLTLNSTGWKLKDVAEGLEILKTKTDDKLFHLVADNWIEGVKNSKREEDAY